MRYTILFLIFLSSSDLQGKCHCHEGVDQPVQKQIVSAVVIAPVVQEPAPALAPPVIVPHPEETEPEKVNFTPVVQLPDPEEPANLKAQAVRAGLFCAATIAVIFAVRYAMSLDNLERAVVDLQGRRQNRPL